MFSSIRAWPALSQSTDMDRHFGWPSRWLLSTPSCSLGSLLVTLFLQISFLVCFSLPNYNHSFPLNFLMARKWHRITAKSHKLTYLLMFINRSWVFVCCCLGMWLSVGHGPIFTWCRKTGSCVLGRLQVSFYFQAGLWSWSWVIGIVW